MNGSAGTDEQDLLAAEEPLEIRVEGQSVAIVMRTPGEDRELAAGFLVTEGLLHKAGDLVDIRHHPHCLLSDQDNRRQRNEADEAVVGEATTLPRRPQDRRQRQLPLPVKNERGEGRGEGYPTADAQASHKKHDPPLPSPLLPQREEREKSSGLSGVVQAAVSSASHRGLPGSGDLRTVPDLSLSEGNVINVRLRQPDALDLKKLTRHVFTSSSCGICSKATIEAVRQQFPPIEDDFEVGPQVLLGLPPALASAQETFKRTGGLHACALFDHTGNLLVLREDVGRHNALDKVVGWALLGDRLPLQRHILLLSGRASFEMMQKALAAGIPIVAAISAPSSLAMEFARDSGQTLVGFLRGERMNVYAGASRLA